MIKENVLHVIKDTVFKGESVPLLFLVILTAKTLPQESVLNASQVSSSIPMDECVNESTLYVRHPTCRMEHVKAAIPATV